MIGTSVGNRFAKRRLAALLVCCAVGCEAEPLEPPVSATAVVAPTLPPPVAAAPASAAANAPPRRPAAVAPAAGATTPTRPSAAAAAALAAYKPPFPERVELFVPPKRQGSVRAKEGDEGDVELLGFIRVDQPKAVLSIDGQPVTIAAGMTVQGVEVISIQPPSAVLQRGRQRWQASLEN